MVAAGRMSIGMSRRRARHSRAANRARRCWYQERRARCSHGKGCCPRAPLACVPRMACCVRKINHTCPCRQGKMGVAVLAVLSAVQVGSYE